MDAPQHTPITKPIFFIDFDRTLFDTEKFYTWLGADVYQRIDAIVEGKLTPPHFNTMIYDDVLEFLKFARTKYHLVLLTFLKVEYSTNPVLMQQLKINGSGVAPYFDEIIITTKDKAIRAKEFLITHEKEGEEHLFVDDEMGNISRMKEENPLTTCYLMSRYTTASARAEDLKFGPDWVIKSLEELQTLLEKTN